MDRPSFVAEEIPHGRSGSTVKGAGIWQILVKDFVKSGLTSAKVNIGERDYKQAYASLAHAIKVMGLREEIRAVRRNAVASVYLQRIPVASETTSSGGNGNGNGHKAEDEPQAATVPVEPAVLAAPDVTEEDAPQSNVA